MSTNPFRRSSLKDPSGSTARNIPDVDRTSTLPLSVDTRAISGSSQKHVNFASPPAIPISPVSYPPSPESTRISPAFHAAQPLLPSATDYSYALQSDPFGEETSDSEGNSAIEAALENAKANTPNTAPSTASTARTKEEAVKDTLSRFASGPRRSSKTASTDEGVAEVVPQKPAMDVDAFKRLLLTGESRASTPKASAVTAPAASGVGGHAVSESSSSADTASSSQHSIFEINAAISHDTPRSSYEMERNDIGAQRQNYNVVGTLAQESRKKPPPPKPRHGKPIGDSRNVSGEADNEKASQDAVPTTQEPSSPAASPPTPTTEQPTADIGSIAAVRHDLKKTPPAPPLARRKSQNAPSGKPHLSRNSSSRTSMGSEVEAPPSPSVHPTSKPAPPPPPPTRRTQHPAERRMSTDLPSTAEEEDGMYERATSPELAPTIPSRTVSFSKRTSQSPITTAPPLPPPRRNRASSRSSVDSQRPSPGMFGVSGSTRDSGEYGRPSASFEGDGGAGSSQAADILADLAALQREVDAARIQNRTD